MATPKNQKDTNAQMIKLLEDIKRLLVLQLLTSGVQTTDIAIALDVNKSSVSRMVPLQKIKKPSRD